MASKCNKCRPGKPCDECSKSSSGCMRCELSPTGKCSMHTHGIQDEPKNEVQSSCMRCELSPTGKCSMHTHEVGNSSSASSASIFLEPNEFDASYDTSAPFEEPVICDVEYDTSPIWYIDHPEDEFVDSTPLCRYGERCKFQTTCPNLHRSSDCRLGIDCQYGTECRFYHKYNLSVDCYAWYNCSKLFFSADDLQMHVSECVKCKQVNIAYTKPRYEDCRELLLFLRKTIINFYGPHDKYGTNFILDMKNLLHFDEFDENATIQTYIANIAVYNYGNILFNYRANRLKSSSISMLGHKPKQYIWINTQEYKSLTNVEEIGLFNTLDILNPPNLQELINEFTSDHEFPIQNPKDFTENYNQFVSYAVSKIPQLSDKYARYVEYSTTPDPWTLLRNYLRKTDEYMLRNFESILTPALGSKNKAEAFIPPELLILQNLLDFCKDPSVIPFCPSLHDRMNCYYLMELFDINFDDIKNAYGIYLAEDDDKNQPSDNDIIYKLADLMSVFAPQGESADSFNNIISEIIVFIFTGTR